MAIEFVPYEDGILGRKAGWNWDPTREVFEDPRFGQVFHVILNMDGKPTNDQMIRCEGSPGCFVAIDEKERVGLVRHEFRPQIRDVDLHRQGFPYQSFANLATNMGRPSWEIPRGYAKTRESGASTATREAAEELDSAVIAFAEIGKVCGNTAMEPHYMTVVVGRVDSTKQGLPADPNERLLRGLTFFTIDEVRALIRQGELYCGTTLAAFALLVAQDRAEILDRLGAA